MRYVILRDDDTNGLTPPACLEQLYRPFLDRRLPVNLAVIPHVHTSAQTPDGKPEGFLFGPQRAAKDTVSLPDSPELLAFLHANPGFRLVQHGCHHDTFEFDCANPREIQRRLDLGTQGFIAAGLPVPRTFVAPHDRLSRPSYVGVAQRFQVLSTGWFELRRLPRSWWPCYLWKKCRHVPHMRVGHTVLLTHPGCLLSCYRPYDQILPTIRQTIARQRLTVLVTHWWEYFRNGTPDKAFIEQLHQTADYLAHAPDIQVIAFDDLVTQRVALN